MTNLHNTESTLLGKSTQHLQARLDALAMVLKDCEGRTCQEPWKALHPAGEVATLVHALHNDFDEFYAAQPKVEFRECLAGYFPENELPRLSSLMGPLTRQDSRDFNYWAGQWSVAG